MELVIENLNKTYSNGVQALKDVNLTIYQGMFGLLGPNGAGKSTLMRTLATLQEADSGTITLGEIDVLTQKEEVRKILGYLTTTENKFTILLREKPRKAGIDPIHKLIDRNSTDNTVEATQFVELGNF